MLELYRVLQPWECGYATRHRFDSLLSLLEKFDDEDPFFADTATVIKFCDEYVEDLQNLPFSCMLDYILYEDNRVIKNYKSRSVEYTVKWVYPHDFDLIQVDDKCYLNREHHIIQFRETGDLYSWQFIQWDGSAAYQLHRLGCISDIVIIGL